MAPLGSSLQNCKKSTCKQLIVRNINELDTYLQLCRFDPNAFLSRSARVSGRVGQISISEVGHFYIAANSLRAICGRVLAWARRETAAWVRIWLRVNSDISEVTSTSEMRDSAVWRFTTWVEI